MKSPSLNFLIFRASCWSCGRRILGLRAVCPHCGKQAPRTARRIYTLYFLLILCAAAFVALHVLEGKF